MRNDLVELDDATITQETTPEGLAILPRASDPTARADISSATRIKVLLGWGSERRVCALPTEPTTHVYNRHVSPDRTAPAPVAAFQTPSGIGELAISPDGSTAVVVSDGSMCVGLIDLGGPPSLEAIDAPAPDAQRYLLRWTDRYPLDPEQIAWHATGGEVVIGEIDQLGKTAVVHWTPPADEPHTLSVGVGNYHYFQSVRTTSP